MSESGSFSKGSYALGAHVGYMFAPKYRAYIGCACTPKKDFDDYKVKSKRVYVAHDFMLALYEKT